MATLMGMNRYFADEGLKGLGNAAALQTQRENTKTQLEAAHDATVKGTTSSMAGSGAMLGYVAAPKIAGMMGPASATPTLSGMASGSIPTVGGSTMATSAAMPTLLEGGGLVADSGLMAGSAATGTEAAVAGTLAETGAGAGSAALAGGEAGSMAGPIGVVAGLAIGALAGWLFSDY